MLRDWIRTKRPSIEAAGAVSECEAAAAKKPSVDAGAAAPVTECSDGVATYHQCNALTPAARYRCWRAIHCAITGSAEPRAWGEPTSQYARRVEEALYRCCVPDYRRYASKVFQLVPNLRRNAARLVAEYGPEELVVLDAGLLARGTEQEHRRLEYEKRVAACRALMAKGDKIFQAVNADSAEALLRCKGCKQSTEILFRTLQTRGADEGMTTFCQCTRCNLRWKFTG